MGKKQTVDITQKGTPIGQKDFETDNKLDSVEDLDSSPGIMASTQPLNDAQAKLLSAAANNGNANNRTMGTPGASKNKNDATVGRRDSSMTREGAGSKMGSSSMAGAKNAAGGSVSFKRPAPPSKISTGSNMLAGR